MGPHSFEQAAPTRRGSDRTRRLGPPGLITADLDHFRRFYEDVFGLRLVSIDHPLRSPFRRLATFADAFEPVVALFVFEIPTFRTDHADDLFGRRGRVDHLVFYARDQAEFVTLTSRLVDVGASSGAVEHCGTLRSVVFVDPDGAHHQLHVVGHSAPPAPSTEVVDPDLFTALHGLDTPITNPTRRQP